VKASLAISSLPFAVKRINGSARYSFADGLEELDPVPSGHVVVGDHTVEAVVGEHLEPVGCARRRFDLEPLVLPIE
jgi:hypothetical protein